MTNITHRIAREGDIPALHELMNRAIAELQAGFLSPDQVHASAQVMGLDSQLVRDGTYFLVEVDGVLAACGGWSWRATLYGGDTSIVKRKPEPLDPAKDAAKVRAMYTHPDFTRMGLGRRVLALCENAARNAGFARTEMMATLAGEPLYRACGYRPIEHIQSREINGVTVPLIRMGKELSV